MSRPQKHVCTESAILIAWLEFCHCGVKWQKMLNKYKKTCDIILLFVALCHLNNIQYNWNTWSYLFQPGSAARCKFQIIFWYYFITCLYRTVLEIDYLFYAESAWNYFFGISKTVTKTCLNTLVVNCVIIIKIINKVFLKWFRDV